MSVRAGEETRGMVHLGVSGCLRNEECEGEWRQCTLRSVSQSGTQEKISLMPWLVRQKVVLGGLG